MSTQPHPRQPAGTPVGGQFATTPHVEATVALTAPGTVATQEIEAWVTSQPWKYPNTPPIAIAAIRKSGSDDRNVWRALYEQAKIKAEVITQEQARADRWDNDRAGVAREIKEWVDPDSWDRPIRGWIAIEVITAFRSDNRDVWLALCEEVRVRGRGRDLAELVAARDVSRRRLAKSIHPTAARDEVDLATRLVHGAVIIATTRGMSESEAARVAGVDQTTVRKWVKERNLPDCGGLVDRFGAPVRRVDR